MQKTLLPVSAVLALPASAFSAGTEIPAVSLWAVLPFVILLLAIALGPFFHRHWWEKNYPIVSLGLGFGVFSYYLLSIGAQRMLETLVDYFSFITLIGSLFIVAGGIYLHTERHASPSINTLLLGIGALVSNLIGTTGASMLLIRPLIRINKQRIRGFHVVFFIFVVSNIGGALTPVGDPPLFLGYLNGVPFTWTITHVWYIWLLAVALVLAVFYVLDSYSYRKWAIEHRRPVGGTRFELLGGQNFFFLFIILAAVFAKTPVREIIMIAAAAAAYRFAGKDALKANEFTFAPIKEVAILFAGIFATMVPALDWLGLNADRLGIKTPGAYYWASGVLSSFLDNAPTYLNFLSAAMGLHHLALGNPSQMSIFIAEHFRFLQAVSVGAVFFGACSYIGNGPNFMVKSIAEHSGVECPSFVGYILKYSMPVLIPIFTVVWLLFFR
jgi:Na+/H+ antiporter NhaD/arsenite permease-like protein